MADRDRRVLPALFPLAGRRVAGIGCGTGRLLGVLTSHGGWAVGIDTDPGMLTIAGTRGVVARADAHRLPFAEASLEAHRRPPPQQAGAAARGGGPALHQARSRTGQQADPG